MTFILFLALLITFVQSDNPKERGKCLEDTCEGISPIPIESSILDRTKRCPKTDFMNELGTNDLGLGDVFPLVSDCEGNICQGTPSISMKTGIINTTLKWPNKTLVYEFDSDFPNKSREAFLQAINHIKGRTCIEFRLRQNSDVDYVNVTNKSDDCSSAVGRIGGRQDINLPEHCGGEFEDVSIHEIVHAIGFYHEHQRTDRDKFVVINWENVNDRAKERGYFDLLNASTVSPYGVPYDYRSIMHYRVDSYSTGKHTITPLDPDVISVIGKVKTLSDFDIKKINNLYCPETQAMRFQNVQDKMYLTVANYSASGRPVTTSNWNDGDNQKWTLDWNALKHSGAPVMTWSLAQLTSEVISANITTGEVDVRKHNDLQHDQIWIAYRKNSTQNSTWLLTMIHPNDGQESHECLVSMGKYQAMIGTCDVNDPRQLWFIYNV